MLMMVRTSVSHHVLAMWDDETDVRGSDGAAPAGVADLAEVVVPGPCLEPQDMAAPTAGSPYSLAALPGRTNAYAAMMRCTWPRSGLRFLWSWWRKMLVATSTGTRALPVRRWPVVEPCDQRSVVKKSWFAGIYLGSECLQARAHREPKRRNKITWLVDQKEKPWAECTDDGASLWPASET